MLAIKIKNDLLKTLRKAFGLVAASRRPTAARHPKRMRAQSVIGCGADAENSGCPSGLGGDPNSMNRQQVIERTVLPFRGVSHCWVDASTMTGKVLCGYRCET